MAIDKALVSFKKLFNKPHTSPTKNLLANENNYIGFSADTSHIFGKKPAEKAPKSFYSISEDNTVEYLRLPLEFIPGTDTISGRHGFRILLPEDYEISSSNPKAGSGFWKNNQPIVNTTGSIQIVSEFSGGSTYRPILRNKLYEQISPLDKREWVLYEFGGVVYQENPPEAGETDKNPGYIDCCLYVGPMANELISSSSSVEIDSITFESQGIELSPSAVKVNFTGSGISGSVTHGNSGDEITYTVQGTTSSIDYRQILFLADNGPFENFSTSSMFHSLSYEPGKPFVSSSIWYTDASQTKKIFEINYRKRNKLKQAEEVLYTVYTNDGITIKSQMKDIVTYDGPIEINRKRMVT